MAKLSRPRPRSSIFISAEGSMKRFTGLFGGNSDKEAPPPPPPLPPALAAHAAAVAAASSPPVGGGGGRQNAPQLSISLPPPSPGHAKTDSQATGTLTPPVSGVGQFSPISRSLSPHLQPLPQSPISGAGGIRNFSGASYASYASQASYSTSYAPSRPGSSQGGNLPVPQPLATVSTMPITAMPAEIPKARRKRQERKGGSGGGIFGKKKKDAVEQPAAWRLNKSSSESLEGYDFGPLMKGEPVPDLWDNNGDTLVYLAPVHSGNPKFTSPFFRISSSPLLFSAFSQYIEDVPQNGQGSNDLLSPDGSRTPNDLFLDVPDRPGSSLNFSRPETPAASDDGWASENDASGNHHTAARDRKKGVMYKMYYPALDLDSPRPSPSKNSKHNAADASKNDTLHQLIDARNLFAFLSLHFLVATSLRESSYSILAKIFEQVRGASSVEAAEAGAFDMSTASKIFMAEAHLLHYVETLRLDDIRNDDDAMVEALVVGEKWRCARLYREGFIHACGRWEETKDLPGFSVVSEATKSRLDRASLNLHQIRLTNVSTRLAQFHYPSIWAGEGRYQELQPWKLAFEAMRKHTISFYKNLYGSWPPKAGRYGKGGGFTETGGLNRMVLKRVYDDFCGLYDLIVDREWIHGERIHFVATYGSDGEDGEEAKSKEERARTSIRKIMAEFDESTMPVQPGIPFDLPRLPYLPTTPPPSANSKKTKHSRVKSKSSKKLNKEDIVSFLSQSYNADVPDGPETLISSFKQLEKDFGTGRTAEETIEARRGRWIFIYCVLQSLPMTIVDAIGLRYGDGVEYFLCESLKGLLPWEKSNRRGSRLSGLWAPGPSGTMMAAGGSSTNLVADDEVDNTYRRSHCWLAAEEWRMVRTADIIEMEGEPGPAEFQGFEFGQGNANPAYQYTPPSPAVGGSDASSRNAGLSPPTFHESYSEDSMKTLQLQGGELSQQQQQQQYEDPQQLQYSGFSPIQQDSEPDYESPENYYHQSYEAPFQPFYFEEPGSPSQVALPASPMVDGRQTPNSGRQEYFSRQVSPQYSSPGYSPQQRGSPSLPAQYSPPRSTPGSPPRLPKLVHEEDPTEERKSEYDLLGRKVVAYDDRGNRIEYQQGPDRI